MLGYYNYTVILTYLGMLAGFQGIISVMNGQLTQAEYLLIAAGICDMFDGKIASTMIRKKKEKRFGIQIDSLSDLICFGVLPAAIVYKLCEGDVLVLTLSSLYVLCALIRLAWFNVDEEERQDLEGGRRHFYLGLPVTSIAIILPIIMEIASTQRWSMQYIGPVTICLCAVAFLTPFRIEKPDIASKAGAVLYGMLGLFCLILLGASS